MSVHGMRFRLAVTLTLAAAAMAAEPPAPRLDHVVVYKKAGRFCGWPANHGIWSWGNEIVVGFELGYFKDNPRGHDIDYTSWRGRSTAAGAGPWSVRRDCSLRRM